jgi:hypothetical protein
MIIYKATGTSDGNSVLCIEYLGIHRVQYWHSQQCWHIQQCHGVHYEYQWNVLTN